MKISNKFKILWKVSDNIFVRLNCFFSRKWPQFLLYKERRKLSRNCWHHAELCKVLALDRNKELLEQHLQSNVCYVPFIDKKTYWKAEKGHLNLSFYWYFRDLDDDLLNNYCRNPGHGTRPWCITNKYMCTRGYCDVCGIGKLYFSNVKNYVIQYLKITCLVEYAI